MAKKEKNESENIRIHTIQCRITNAEREYIRELAHGQYISMGAYLYKALKAQLKREEGGNLK